jgi:hypothetical protein
MSREQATLPDGLERPNLAGMTIGQTAYTMPWMMWADSDRRLWLIPSAPAHGQPGGTVRMRVDLRRDGYHVWLPADQYYDPQGSAEAGSIPVAELHT